jgi:hypothetical protein
MVDVAIPYAPRNLSKFFESSVTEKNLEGSSSDAAAAAAISERNRIRGERWAMKRGQGKRRKERTE